MSGPSGEWEILIRCAGRGHRYFRHLPSGRVAAADFSGATPDRTEDGILWIDPSRPAVLYHDMVAVPVTSELDGRRYVVGDPLAGGIEVVHRLGLDVRAEGALAEFLEAAFRSAVGIRVGGAVRRVS